MQYDSFEDIIEYCRELFEDISFSYARDWKEAGNDRSDRSDQSDRKVIGYLPIYIPREIIHAAGMLPVGLFGAGDRIPVVRGDAFFQSYICHLPRTVVELAVSGRMDHFDGYIFPSICDVIRNLSGIFKLTFKDKYVRYLDFPQNFDSSVGGEFYRQELERLCDSLTEMNGHAISPDNLNKAIALYNKNRELLSQLDSIRVTTPHKMSAVDFYLLRRAGHTVTVEDHNDLLRNSIEFLSSIVTEEEDKIHVIVSGAFCEQPPLGLIKTIEIAGCYIVDDDFQAGLNWFADSIPCDSDDPLGALVTSYLTNKTDSSAVYEREDLRGVSLANRVRERKADGVIFCAPSFCDPALLDRPILERTLNEYQIKHTSFQYHENLGQFHVIKEQAGTFADTIKLWE